MQHRTRTAAIGMFEPLEPRLVLATINVLEFGAIPGDGLDDTAAIEAALDRAGSGDTVLFPEGTYELRRTLVVRSGESIIGENATLHFRGVRYGFDLANDADNVTFRGLDMDGGGIRMHAGGMHSNVLIEGNLIRNFNTGGVGGGIYATTRTENLMIRHNEIRDAQNSWGAQIYYGNRLTIERNTFHNLMQGAHLLNMYDDCRVSYNKVTQIRRMGFEIQDLDWSRDNPMRNLVVEGNAVYDFRDAYYESFGLSVVRQNSINTRVINNYVRADNTPRPGTRYGIGIEFSARTDGNSQGNQSTNANNVTVGRWFAHIAHYWPEQRIENNRLFDNHAGGGHIAAWRGHGGTPNNNRATGNIINLNVNDAPQPPTDIGAGSGGGIGAPSLPPGGGSGGGFIGGGDGSGNGGGDGGENGGTGGFAPVQGPFNPQGPQNPAGGGGEGGTGGGENPAPTNPPGEPGGGNGTGNGGTTGGGSVGAGNDGGPTSQLVFLSDLPWRSAVNGYGPISLDASMTDVDQDGIQDPIRIDGRQYEKGLGVAPESIITYDLNGQYKQFFSVIGIEDISENRGSVVFQVWVDGRKMYDSGIQRGGDSGKQVALDVRGAERLQLIVTNARDGDRDDIASWANARLTT